MTEERTTNNNNKKKIIVVVVLVLVAASYLVHHFWSRGRVTTDDAYVAGNVHSVTPRVAGYVAEVLVDDNQKVEKGQPLVRLDPTDYEVARAQARAELAEAEAVLASTELGVPLELDQTGLKVEEAKARLESLKQTRSGLVEEEEAAAQDLVGARAEYAQAKLDLSRQQDLRQSHAVSQSAVDAAQTKVETTLAQVKGAEARLEGVRKRRASYDAQVEGIQADIGLAATGEGQAEIKSRGVEAQKARVELARSKMHKAELDLEYSVIKSPVDGFVTRKSVDTGLMVSRGQPLMAVVPLAPEKIWILANFKETQLSDVKPGQRATFKVDTYPGVTLAGTVDSIMSGTGAVFSLFPPENASGNFVKIVQRIPVKIAIDQADDMPILRLGMSVVLTIYTGE